MIKRRTMSRSYIALCMLMPLWITGFNSTAVAEPVFRLDKDVVSLGADQRRYVDATCRFKDNTLVLFGGYFPDKNNGYIFTYSQEGDNWTQAKAISTPWVKVHCPENGSAAVAVSQSGVYRSIDGTNWQQIYTPQKGKIVAASFVNRHIFFTTDQKELHVNDGGGQWTVTPFAMKGKTSHLLAFSSPRNGILWMTTWFDDLRFGHEGYWTQDGGQTWKPIVLEGIKRWMMHENEVAYFDDVNAIAIADLLDKNSPLKRRHIVRSHDGGHDWTVVPNPNTTDNWKWEQELERGPENTVLIWSSGSLYLSALQQVSPVHVKVEGPTELSGATIEKSYRDVTVQDNRIRIVVGINEWYLFEGHLEGIEQREKQ